MPTNRIEFPSKDMKLSIRSAESIFSVVSLILFSQGFYSIIFGQAIGGDGGDLDSALLRFAFSLNLFSYFCFIRVSFI